MFAIARCGRRPTLGCSRRGPLRFCLPSCAIMASRAARLNPGPLGAQGMDRIVVMFFALVAGCRSHDLTPAHVETQLPVAESMAAPRGAGSVEVPPFIRVIALPEKYHRRTIQLIGYINLEFEGNALYLSRELFLHGGSGDAIWVDVEGMKIQPAFRRGRVIIEGTFNAERRGHFGMFAGTLESISRLDPWRQ